MDESLKTVSISQDYIDRHIITVQTRLKAAGVRLGQVLNQVFVNDGPVAWPAEPRDEAIPLFAAGVKNISGQDNWSGAHWNPKKEILWLCRNDHEFRAYKRNGANWTLNNGPYEIDADFEAITQSDYEQQKVLLLIEKDPEKIEEYDVSGVSARLIRSWDIADINSHNDGFEGMVFIPDEFLPDTFVDSNGDPYPNSRFGFGGIVLTSHQNEGEIYALDLNTDNTVEIIGVYEIPLKETRGLEFDRSTKRLHAIDGYGYAVMSLASDEISDNRRAFQIHQYTEGPGPVGLEGIALPPKSSGEQWAILTDDENTADRAVVIYNQFDN